MNLKRPPSLAWAPLAATLLFAAGCGEKGMEKVVVTGQVTFNGTAIDNGEIRFYPAAGSTGPVSGAPIVKGRYEAKAKGGVPVGSHRVEIRGFRPPGSAKATSAASTAPGDGSGPPEQYLPAKYNDETTLTLTVSAEESQLVHDFNLVE